MRPHPVAAEVGALVAARDPERLATVLTETVRLRALLPGGPIEVHGREEVAARFQAFFAGFDTVQLVEATGEGVADRLLVHYRLHVARGTTRWVCTQTAIGKTVDGLLAVIDLLCSGFREVLDEHVAA
ncbi:nuclear transport factor 2 family protein [Pseudonocardia kujensis]|uniref:nuclear transport factor 2 family protein n=1 Tax=Pseudonocardia kujensis TaxID=1128675 RepID=UPI001E3AB026|nr:nuclear transport factor 2 family protein [Pseudonocardia kujensis]MCE0765410.1 nuclear transport factor 2 family protein [Pseudonocardia kujensis]